MIISFSTPYQIVLETTLYIKTAKQKFFYIA